MTEQQRKPIAFIAGPMTGYVNYNRDEFNAEASVLEDRGFTILNPAILPDGLEHQQYLAITLSMLEQADVVFLLDGWEKSIGALREFQRARELGLMFMFQSWETAHLAIMHSRFPVREMTCE
ncbi:DUF4406 domain-containing protein [Citrobacter portucalensis]|uniref:DUF4406 domain-containing protein n=1 Tax=Citrobacter portucalensis TaxID=1639133 RepID=UPI00226B363C|nr:DUF4406 domain-containing protein [Citrobacter portucalensis]MCX9038831.1 DUF4406 domain-containing protein [Citrobacter portucalensis]